MKKVLIIIQARQTSSRLPNKIFLPLFKKPLFHFLYNRLKELPFNLIVAAPNTNNNISLAKYLVNNDLNYFLGSENNVFKRFLEVIKLHSPDLIVRVNSDCPFLSPQNVESIVNQFLNLNTDYLSTTLDESFPVGEHIEVISSEAFIRASEDILTSSTKEHVTPIFYKSEKYKSLAYSPLKEIIYPFSLRLCIDYIEDYVFFKELEKILCRENFTYEELIKICNDNQDLISINSEFKKSRTV